MFAHKHTQFKYKATKSSKQSHTHTHEYGKVFTEFIEMHIRVDFVDKNTVKIEPMPPECLLFVRFMQYRNNFSIASDQTTHIQYKRGL